MSVIVVSNGNHDWRFLSPGGKEDLKKGAFPVLGILHCFGSERALGPLFLWFGVCLLLLASSPVVMRLFRK